MSSSLLSTCIIIEHPKAVRMVMPKELASNDTVVLVDYLHVLLIEALPEPRFVPCLFKEPRGYMPDNIDL